MAATRQVRVVGRERPRRICPEGAACSYLKACVCWDGRLNNAAEFGIRYYTSTLPFYGMRQLARSSRSGKRPVGLSPPLAPLSTAFAPSSGRSSSLAFPKPPACSKPCPAATAALPFPPFPSLPRTINAPTPGCPNPIAGLPSPHPQSTRHPSHRIPSFASPVKPSWYYQSTADPANTHRTEPEPHRRTQRLKLRDPRLANAAPSRLKRHRRGLSKTVATEESSFRHRTARVVCSSCPNLTSPPSQLPLEARAPPKLYIHAA